MRNRSVYTSILIIILITLSISGCAKSEDRTAEVPDTYSVAVFIPGVVAGSPTYEMMADGAQRAISETENGSIKIIEGGYNQGEWLEKIEQI